MMSFDGKYQNVSNALQSVATAFKMFEILAFQIVYAEDLGQGRRIQHLQ